VVLIPLSEIPEMFRKEEIDHAIVITALCPFFLNERRRN